MSTKVVVRVKGAGTVLVLVVIAAGVVTVVDTTTVEMGTSWEQKAEASGSVPRAETAPAKQLQSEDEAAAEATTARMDRIELSMLNLSCLLHRCSVDRNTEGLYVVYPSPMTSYQH
jgi:hypothetical protein